MSNLSTYSTSDKTVFKTVSEDWVVSAPVSLDTYRLYNGYPGYPCIDGIGIRAYFTVDNLQNYVLQVAM